MLPPIPKIPNSIFFGAFQRFRHFEEYLIYNIFDILSFQVKKSLHGPGYPPYQGGTPQRFRKTGREQACRIENISSNWRQNRSQHLNTWCILGNVLQWFSIFFELLLYQIYVSIVFWIGISFIFFVCSRLFDYHFFNQPICVSVHRADKIA